MHKYWKHLVVSGDPNAKKWKLPFPYLITQLLVLRRFVVDNDEISEAPRVTFRLAQWNLSLSHMPSAKKEGDGMVAGAREDVNALVEDVVGRSEEQIADGATYEIAQAVSPHAEESAGVTRAEFNAIMGQLRTELAESREQHRVEHVELIQQHTTTQRMLRDLYEIVSSSLPRTSTLPPDA
ncbi:uncharacterized protein LOC132285960 [Cornus florida]|uniref:uncharacterized protein LOC132285960 n=1 Tax=Cornus florida TaxID=4283 RepID=UPI00289FE703|nr:uncharacterized protein LOC132285960 [Cornus florida]